jgi:hypothetical protein
MLKLRVDVFWFEMLKPMSSSFWVWSVKPKDSSSRYYDLDLNQ